MTENARGRVVVITGASAGVGRATAQAFAREGAKIGLIARGREGLEAARAEVVRLGGEALALPLDVAEAEAVEGAAAAVEQAFGPIDVWINNAMASVFSPVAEMTAEAARDRAPRTHRDFRRHRPARRRAQSDHQRLTAASKQPDPANELVIYLAGLKPTGV